MSWGSLPGQRLDKDFVRGVSRTLKTIVNLGSPPTDPCRYGERTLGTAVLSDYRGEDINVSLVSESLAQELFDKVAKKEHIPFGYPEDGCYARAHEMARILEKEGVITAKAFIEGDLRVETSNSPKGYVEWWYHVAPIIQVEVDGKQQPYVIDPSIFDKPVPIEQWYEVQTSHERGRKDNTYITRRFNYTPLDKHRARDSYEKEDVNGMEHTIKNYSDVLETRSSSSDIEGDL